MYAKYIKRLFDFTLSLLAIIILSPVLLIVAVLVRTKLGSPTIFKQERPGLHEKIFTLYKFRTMTDEKDEEGNLLPDEVRLTKFGKLLRSTSLDELPELFNILKGDMAIVGPRPLRVQYLPYYNNKEKQRHDIRPGLTGLAQVSGRNGLQWEERFEYDIEYLKNYSLFYDIHIIFLTLKKVFIKENIMVRGTTNIKDFDTYRKEKNNEVDNGNWE